MITEKDNVFYCDCGFSFARGRSGTHDCAAGLRNKLAESEAKCVALAAENAGLKESRKNLAEFIHEELDAGYPLNMSIETPDTDAFLAEVRAQGVEMAAKSDQFSTWVQQGLRSFAIGVRQGDEE
ncbi:hypothetical protein [Enterobacter asburiae]|uniref:hypothetical protein n=1 Tax=Enterobacter asburiae TaxID=61645 RepID=UPI00210B5D4B|nr:hypothetical protein [Enterobacter asburiae]MCQ4370015.1 hypothetical protein [Enterobacter asburiae]HDC4620395.1 hypothetical protein [Enterobacter asburiae]